MLHTVIKSDKNVLWFSDLKNDKNIFDSYLRKQLQCTLYTNNTSLSKNYSYILQKLYESIRKQVVNNFYNKKYILSHSEKRFVFVLKMIYLHLC